jgi:lantibiotic modifying enzyme
MSAHSGTWRPLLDGELAARANDAIGGISEALTATVFEGGAEDRGFSLGGSGTPGLALFYGYLARTAGAEHHAERVDLLLDRASEALAATPMSAALYSGFTGVAWAAEHLSMASSALDGDLDVDLNDEDINEEIDAALLAALSVPWAGNYDLISGLVGFGVYALERVPRPSAVACVEAIVDRLAQTAVQLGERVTWFTSPDMLPPRNRSDHPDGYYNVGVAHGVPGVIALLADACRLGIRVERARPLLDGAVQWVLSQRLSTRPGARYPAVVVPGIEPKPSRLAWCYGDPGVAATLLYAAHALGQEQWERAALDIATHAANATPAESGIRDAGLCHGAFGLAHVYNRIHQATGDELFAGAARLWYRLGLDMRRPEGGVAGFEAWNPDKEPEWVAEAGFLTGAAGIGLALLAGVTPVEPKWDRLLMVAIPPRLTDRAA